MFLSGCETFEKCLEIDVILGSERDFIMHIVDYYIKNNDINFFVTYCFYNRFSDIVLDHSIEVDLGEYTKEDVKMAYEIFLDHNISNEQLM